MWQKSVYPCAWQCIIERKLDLKIKQPLTGYALVLIQFSSRLIFYQLVSTTFEMNPIHCILFGREVKIVYIISQLGSEVTQE